MTVKSNGRVLINKDWSLSLTGVRLLASMFSSGLWSVSRWNILPKNRWILYGPCNYKGLKLTCNICSFDVARDFCWWRRLSGPLEGGLHLSDLMKSTEVDESLSTTSTDILFQRIPTNFKIEDGFLLKSNKNYYPSSERQDLLNQLHTGHLGFSKCLYRRKQTINWPVLYDQISELATTCQTCLKFFIDNCKQPTSKQLGHGSDTCTLEPNCNWHFSF